MPPAEPATGRLAVGPAAAAQLRALLARHPAVANAIGDNFLIMPTTERTVDALEDGWYRVAWNADGKALRDGRVWHYRLVVRARLRLDGATPPALEDWHLEPLVQDAD